MNEAFVFTTIYRKQPKLRVSYRDGTTKSYPLTELGCTLAGIDLFKNGVESWTNSSTVDFPECCECTFDIRKLMEDGYNAAFEEFQKPQKELIALIMKWCQKKDFQQTLTGKQQELFKVLARKIKKEGK